MSDFLDPARATHSPPRGGPLSPLQARKLADMQSQESSSRSSSPRPVSPRSRDQLSVQEASFNSATSTGDWVRSTERHNFTWHASRIL